MDNKCMSRLFDNKDLLEEEIKRLNDELLELKIKLTEVNTKIRKLVIEYKE